MWFLAGLGLLALVACNFDDGHPPVARVLATPKAIPENDGFQTAVTLDGSASADPVDDPEGVGTLEYRWQFRGDEYQFVDGTPTSVAPVLSFRGDRPPTIELTVTDVDGLEGMVSFELQLTVR